MIHIRRATLADYDGVWAIFSAVIQSGDTYVFDPQTPKTDLSKHWFAPYMHTFVAEEAGVVVGSYIIKANQIDLGAHVANGSYMVHPDHHNKGIGRLLCQHSLNVAKNLGFLAMQFNIVVSTNTAAVALWQKCGFKIVGTVPLVFKHAQLGLVDAYVMHRFLTD